MKCASIFVDKTTFNNRKEKKCLHVLVFQETEQSKLSNNPKCFKKVWLQKCFHDFALRVFNDHEP